MSDELAAVLAALQRLEDGQGLLRANLMHMKDGQDLLRADLMARMDRMQDRLVTIGKGNRNGAEDRS